MDSKPLTGKDKTMGISMITALEIFTNPGDLVITIKQKKRGAEFAIGIFRGHGHNFKPMLTTQPFAKTREDAIKVVVETFQIIRDISTKGLKDQDIDQSTVLNQDLIDRIIEELQAHGEASTCKMLALAS